MVFKKCGLQYNIKFDKTVNLATDGNKIQWPNSCVTKQIFQIPFGNDKLLKIIFISLAKDKQIKWKKNFSDLQNFRKTRWQARPKQDMFKYELLGCRVVIQSTIQYYFFYTLNVISSTESNFLFRYTIFVICCFMFSWFFVLFYFLHCWHHE